MISKSDFTVHGLDEEGRVNGQPGHLITASAPATYFFEDVKRGSRPTQSWYQHSTLHRNSKGYHICTLTHNCRPTTGLMVRPVPKRILLKRTANILKTIVKATFEFACYYSHAPFVCITDCIPRLVIGPMQTKLSSNCSNVLRHFTNTLYVGLEV